MLDEYDAFGALRGTAAENNPYRYTGEPQDPTVARSPYYLRARYYDPAIGRFLSRDPWPANPMNPQSLDRYAYAYNNPMRYVDPFGLRNAEGGNFHPKAWNGVKGVVRTVRDGWNRAEDAYYQLDNDVLNLSFNDAYSRCIVSTHDAVSLGACMLIWNKNTRLKTFEIGVCQAEVVKCTRLECEPSQLAECLVDSLSR